MDPDLKWLIGTALTVLVFVGGLIAGVFRSLAARISKTSGELHSRIDGVKDNYVRRDDLDSHIQRLDDNIRDMRHEFRDSHKQVIEAIRSAKD